MSTFEQTKNTMGGRKSSEPLRVAVIGGGITGLATAQRLISMDPDVCVTIFEAADRVGGIIQTVNRDDYLIELGPDSFITNKPAAIELCRDIGFEDQLIATDDKWRRSLVVRNGRPLPVPNGFMLMAPAKPLSILTTPVLSIAGRLRLLSEALIPRRTDTSDESLASFVRRRFGNETFERLVQPLIGGIYTSDPEMLSLEATLPRFVELERQYGSVIRGTLAELKRRNDNDAAVSGSGARYGLFATPRLGLSSLIQAAETWLHESQRVEFRLKTGVRALSSSRRPERGAWHVNTMDERDFDFDAVIVTLPAYHAADLLLDEPFWSLAEHLRRIEYASSAIVVSGHRLEDFRHSLDAFGMVVPHREQRRILAVSFTSRKFVGRAPAGHVLLRTFIGGATQPEMLRHSDEELGEIVCEELSDLLGMKAPPEFMMTARYARAMPQYHLGHVDLVRTIQDECDQHFGLWLAGNAYKGVGIPDSIASGRSAAEDCLATLHEHIGHG